MDEEIEIPHVGLINSLSEINELECEDDYDYNVLNEDFDIPMYERALQNLFGKETADRFVHPKIDESAGVAGMTATLHSQRIKGITDRKRYKQNGELSLSKIQTNAERLWSLLRENSSYNILKEDNKIDPGLKGSFNAFARGFIDRNMTPPQRSFVEDEELTKMRNRMKSKKVAKIDLNSRKKHLMFELAELQEGNQIMLLRDKSFIVTDGPGVRELLFPPIIEEPIVPSQEPKTKKMDKTYHQMLMGMDIDVVNEEALFEEKPTTGQMNLKFFNEKDSLRILKEKNSFRDNISKKMGQTDNVMEQMIDKSRRWSEEDLTRSRERQVYMEQSRSNIRARQKQGSSGARVDTQALPWQPLTLGAVMDFKITRKPTFVFEADDGQFRQGACRLWRPKLAMS